MEPNGIVNQSSNKASRPLLTNSRLATDLLGVANYLCMESSSASVLVEKAVSLFFYKNQSRFKVEMRLGDFNPSQYVFKRNDFFFLVKKLVFFFKRDFLSRLKTKASLEFEKLNWKERLVLALSHKYRFSASDISHILDLSRAQYIETLYNAKLVLGVDLEERTYDQNEIRFNDSDNHFFYQKNIEIYSILNTSSEDTQSALISKFLPNYGISLEDQKRVSQQILKALRKIKS